jgi:chromosome segregation ATPase
MAKNRFATKALNKNDEPIIATLELNVNSMNIEIKTFPIGTLTENNSDDFIRKFIAEEEIIFPESTLVENRSFTEESLLPDHIKVDGKSGAIRQLQNEWSYLLLNTKLFEQFNTELDEIKLKASELKNFSSDLFDEAKSFWEKVLEYKKEREISQEKLSYFKEEINGVFDHLKILKESMLKEKDEISEKIKTEITSALDIINDKLDQQGAHFKTIMDELKELQTKLKGENVKREIKNVLFDNIQAAFEKLKSKKDDHFGAGNNSRVEGLTKVLDRMMHTLNLDIKDLDFNTKKLNSVNSKLELQLREAKINVLKDRIASKQEKVDDIQKTLNKLTSKKSSSQSEKNKEAEPTLMGALLTNLADKIETVKDAVEEGTIIVKEKSKKVRAKAEEKLEEAKSTIDETSDKIMESIAEKQIELTETANELKSIAAEKLEEIKETTQEKAVDMIENIEEKLDKIKAEISDKKED